MRLLPWKPKILVTVQSTISSKETGEEREKVGNSTKVFEIVIMSERNLNNEASVSE